MKDWMRSSAGLGPGEDGRLPETLGETPWFFSLNIRRPGCPLNATGAPSLFMATGIMPGLPACGKELKELKEKYAFDHIVL